MSKVQRRVEVAREVREAAREWGDQAKSEFAREHNLVGAYRADAADLREVAKMIRTGHIVAASRKVWYLDTIVRELVPQSAFDLFASEGVKC